MLLPMIVALAALNIVVFQQQNTPAEILTANFIYLTYFLIYFEFFSMMCRGFSFHIIKLVSDQAPIQENEVMKLYGEGMGAAGMMKKRLESMAKGGLVRIEGDKVIAQGWKSKLIAFVARAYKSLIKMGWEG